MIIKRVVGWPTWEWRSPFNEWERMRRDMDRLMEGMLGSQYTGARAGVFPPLNITEDADNYYIRAELPGMNAEQLDLSVTGNDLSISGERTIPAENESVKYHRREREAGRFSRMITLPSQINPAKVSARNVDGVLTVLLPKAEAAKPKKISVKSS